MVRLTVSRTRRIKQEQTISAFSQQDDVVFMKVEDAIRMIYKFQKRDKLAFSDVKEAKQ